MNWAAILWFILAVVFILVEANTVSMVSAWFAIGALIAMLVSYMGGGFWLQAVIFFVISGALLFALRPLAKKYFTPKLTKTNVDSIIGTTGPVLTQIDNVMATGQVKLGAMEWTARSSTGEVIPAGTLVKVNKVEGVKVFVSPAEEKVSV